MDRLEVRTAAGPWWVVLGLASAAAVALGIARFAYALLLPAMSADLHWSYAQAGALSSANAAGYVLGALGTLAVARRVGTHRAFVGSVAVTALVMAISGLPHDFAWFLVLRFLAGVSGALAFVLGASLATRVGALMGGARAALVVGLYTGGVGLGLLASASSVPALLASPGAGWRTAWLVLGGISAVGTWAAAAAVRHIPPAPAAHARPGAGRWPARKYVAAIFAYGCFGAGYIGYMTFIIAFLRKAGGSDALVPRFWATLGAANVLSGYVWWRVLAQLRGGRALALVLTGVLGGALLPLASRAQAPMLLSALLFGGSFLQVVSACTVLVQRTVQPAAWPSAIAIFTVVFAAGQAVGPLLTGLISDASGLGGGLLVSAGVLALGACAALLQREPAAPVAD